MPMRYVWYTPDKTVMRYVAEGLWNWQDYHRTVRIATFAMMRQPAASVISLIDLRASGRPTLPAGLGAHARTFGKRYVEALSGQAIVLGVAPEKIPPGTVGEDGILKTPDGSVVFAVDEDAARALLTTWGVTFQAT